MREKKLLVSTTPHRRRSTSVTEGRFAWVFAPPEVTPYSLQLRTIWNSSPPTCNATYNTQKFDLLKHMYNLCTIASTIKTFPKKERRINDSRTKSCRDLVRRGASGSGFYNPPRAAPDQNPTSAQMTYAINTCSPNWLVLGTGEGPLVVVLLLKRDRTPP